MTRTGWIYLAQMQPLLPEILKMGYTRRPKKRLAAYRTGNPNARFIAGWAGNQRDERRLTQTVFPAYCEHIRGENWRCSDIKSLIKAMKDYFQAPKRYAVLNTKREAIEVSPFSMRLNQRFKEIEAASVLLLKQMGYSEKAVVQLLQETAEARKREAKHSCRIVEGPESFGISIHVLSRLTQCSVPDLQSKQYSSART